MTDLIDAFSRLISLLVAFCGIAGTAYFIWGAYHYMSAGGSPQKAETGKTAMLQAGMGVILILVAFSVINTLTSQIGASAGAVQIEQIAPTDSQRLVAPRVVGSYTPLPRRLSLHRCVFLRARRHRGSLDRNGPTAGSPATMGTLNCPDVS